MASSGKRKNKTTWKAPQNEIIQISAARNYSWADEVENEAEEYYDPKPVVLPTAPRASCMVAVDESKVPHTPPFQAHVSNLPYELTDNELRDLFPESNVKDVRIPKEEKGNRARGYGYVEFEDRSSLLTALHMGETYVKGRSVRIELATSDSGRGGGRSRGSQRSDSGSMHSSSIDRTAGNWRSGPREETEDRDRGFDRGGPRREYGQGGFSRREDNFERDRREERYLPRDRERGERFSRDDRPKYNDDWGARDSDRRFRRDDRDRNEPAPRSEMSNEPKNRPKLQLQPRSSNLPPPAATNEPTSSNSIFGNAKPVDTSAKLREIEERLAKTEMMSEKSRSGGSSTGSSAGPASTRPQEGKEKKLEPAQPPKENAWAKPRILQQEKRASRPDDKKDI